MQLKIDDIIVNVEIIRKNNKNLYKLSINIQTFVKLKLSYNRI